VSFDTSHFGSMPCKAGQARVNGLVHWRIRCFCTVPVFDQDQFLSLADKPQSIKINMEIRFLILSIAALLCSPCFGGVIAYNGFESSGDTWAYTLDPDVQGNATGDTWDSITGFGTSVTLQAPDSGSRFWGGRDMDGLQSGALDGVRPYIIFDNVDVTGLTDVAVSFSYAYESLSSGADQMGYLLAYTTDGSDVDFGTLEHAILDNQDPPMWVDMTTFPNATVLFKVPSGGGFTTNGWTSETIYIPAGATKVRLALYAYVDGGTNYSGFDSVRVEDGVTPPVADSLSIDSVAGSLQVEYSGILEESTDLSTWTQLDPQPASPLIISVSTGEAKFFRLAP
jgi:hypothetical protein